MEVVGSTEQVNVVVVVQVDRAADYNLNDDNWRTTPRFYITKGSDRRKITSQLLKDLGPTNTGDSRFVSDFIRETVADYPAQRSGTCWCCGIMGAGFTRLWPIRPPPKGSRVTELRTGVRVISEIRSSPSGQDSD